MELSPQWNADDTEVKVPSRSSSALAQTPDRSRKGDNIAKDLSGLDDTLPCAGQNGESTYNGEPVAYTALTDAQLAQLEVYFHGYPRDMFKEALVKLYASCDVKLGEVRADLFVRVSNLDGFPYVGQSMKRRMQTRLGLTLAQKLCLDIHTLIAILRGGDFACPELKELLSTSPRRHSSVNGTQSSSSAVHTIPPSGPQQQSSPSRDNESGTPSTSMSCLQSELATIKQIYNANESLRSTQMCELKETLSSVCQEIAELRSDVRSSLESYQARIDRLESVQASCTSSNKSDIKCLSQDLKTFEFSLGVLTESLNNTLLNSVRSEKTKKKGRNTRDVGCQNDIHIHVPKDSNGDSRDVTSGHTDSTLGDPNFINVLDKPSGPNLQSSATASQTQQESIGSTLSPAAVMYDDVESRLNSPEYMAQRLYVVNPPAQESLYTQTSQLQRNSPMNIHSLEDFPSLPRVQGSFTPQSHTPGANVQKTHDNDVSLSGNVNMPIVGTKSHNVPPHAYDVSRDDRVEIGAGGTGNSFSPTVHAKVPSIDDAGSAGAADRINDFTRNGHVGIGTGDSHASSGNQHAAAFGPNIHMSGNAGQGADVLRTDAFVETGTGNPHAGDGNPPVVAFGANVYTGGNAGQGPGGYHTDVAYDVPRGAYVRTGTGDPYTGDGNSQAVAFGPIVHMSGNAGQGEGAGGSHTDVYHVNDVSRGAFVGIGTGDPYAGYGHSHAVAFGANVYRSSNAGQGPGGSHTDVAHVNDVSRGTYAGIGNGNSHASAGHSHAVAFGPNIHMSGDAVQSAGGSHTDVAYADVTNRMGNAYNADQGRGSFVRDPRFIPSRVTNRKQKVSNDKSLPSDNTADQATDFLSDYVRKKTKRFYLGGFNSNVTERVIGLHINDKGPKVTKINIFRSNFRPPVIRLNVEDDENVFLVSEPGFWPNGIVCKPWVSKTRYRARNAPSDGVDQTSYYNNQNQTQQRADWSDPNMYGNLASCGVD